MRVLLFCAMVALVPLRVFAEDWPRFRGPNGQGHSSEKNLPLEWSTNHNVAWRTIIPGDGWSSPVVWNNRVYLTSTTDAGTKCNAFCVDAVSGRILWTRQLFEQVPRRKESKNSYATPTPATATDGSSIFVTFGDGSMAALSREGEILWKNREVKFYSRHGLASSPIVHEKLVIQCFDGSNPVAQAGNWPDIGDEEGLGWRAPWDRAEVAALDVATGKRIWTGKRGMSRIAHVTPIIATVDGRKQLISGAGDRMQGFDLEAGKLIWSVFQQGEGVTPSPVLGDGVLYASSGFEKTTLRAIKLGGATGDVTSTHILWEQRKGVPTQPSPLLANARLYGVSDSGGMVTCFRPQDGEILWQERIGGNYSASPVFADNRIYFLNEAAETTVIAAGPEFKVMAKNKLEGRTQASMAVSNGRLFIRTDKGLFCIAAK